ncbi:aspartate/glutamate racemase family protein, partial [Kibdelosporangium lantanae]
AAEAAAAGYTKVGVLGTKWTMDSSLYPSALARHGLDAEVPEEDERADVDRIIFDELVNGIVRDESRGRYLTIIEHLRDRGCDAVALVCTEIPLLVTPEGSPLPTLDSPTLLARAACRLAVDNGDLPTWRGGEVR